MEDGSLGNLAPPGHLEESASHHVPGVTVDAQISHGYHWKEKDIIQTTQGFPMLGCSVDRFATLLGSIEKHWKFMKTMEPMRETYKILFSFMFYCVFMV